MHQDVHQQQHESVCILNGAHQGCAKLEKQIICTQENYQNCLFGGCLAGNKCHHVTRSLCSGSLDEINNNISGGNPGTQYRTVGGESGDQIVQQSFQLCPRGLTSLLVKKKSTMRLPRNSLRPIPTCVRAFNIGRSFFLLIAVTHKKWWQGHTPKRKLRSKIIVKGHKGDC